MAPYRIQTATECMVERWKRELIVEMRGIQIDGKPAAYKLRQLNLMAYLALGRGIPSIQPAGYGNGADEEDLEEKARYMRRILGEVIVAQSAVIQDEADGPYRREWLPVKVVDRAPNPDAEPREIWIEDADLVDTVIRVWNLITRDVQFGGGFEKFEDHTFRGEGPSDGRLDREGVRQVAARGRPRVRSAPRG